MLHEIDDEFLNILSALVGSGVEMAFERRGEGTTTYPLHGEIVAVDESAGTIQILRTRTHAGEVHTMGLRYFLTATAPDCDPLINTLAKARLQADLQKGIARETAIEQVKASAGSSHIHSLTQSRYQGNATGSMVGYPSNRYVFADKVDPTRTVGIIARSMADATQFMASQDLFMSLDDSLELAITGHVLWPAGIAYATVQNPEAWRAPWQEIFKVLDGLTVRALTFYLQKIRRGSQSISDTETIGNAAIQSLTARGLLQTEGRPASYEETVKRIPVAGLKELLRSAGAKSKLPTRLLLEAEVLSVMTSNPSNLHEKALQLMRAPKTVVRAPCGLSNDEFAHAIKELRDSIFIMRQWLRSTYELEREEELRAFAARM